MITYLLGQSADERRRRGRSRDDDQKRRPREHRHGCDGEPGGAGVDRQVVSSGERLRRDERREEGDREQRADPADARIGEDALRHRDARQLEDIAADRAGEHGGPHQPSPAHGRSPAATATSAARSTGTPAATNGVETNAARTASTATIAVSRCRSRGATSARNAAGAAASRPSERGSASTLAPRAPIAVPVFQHTKTARPVAQNPSRPARGSSRAVAIAVLSSMTRWAAPSRRRPHTPRSGASRTP